MTLQALRDQVIVRPVHEKTRHGGMIILSDSAKYATRKYMGDFYGVVVAIGPKYPYKDEVKLGDKILFRRHEGKVIMVAGIRYLILKERWVEAKLV